MAGKGRKFKFHGAFKSKRKAVERERETKGAFIREVMINHHRRFDVLTRREK